MNDEEKMIIKSLNKIGVDTRFISLYDNKIFINNLKFSKFSRKKEEKFIKEYPSIEIIRSKLFQKICIKVSRTVKHNIKPKIEIPRSNSTNGRGGNYPYTPPISYHDNQVEKGCCKDNNYCIIF
jgi:hypothetical protein